MDSLNKLRRSLVITYSITAIINLIMFILVNIESIDWGMYANIVLIFLLMINITSFILTTILFIRNKKLFLSNASSIALKLAFIASIVFAGPTIGKFLTL